LAVSDGGRRKARALPASSTTPFVGARGQRCRLATRRCRPWGRPSWLRHTPLPRICPTRMPWVGRSQRGAWWKPSAWVVVGPAPPCFACLCLAPPRRLDTGEHVTCLLSQAMTCTDTTRAPVQLDEHICFLLDVATRRITKLYNRRLRRFGITYNHLFILTC